MDILVAPNACQKYTQVKLPRPKDGLPQDFLYDEDNITLYEVTKYSDKFKSWFIDQLFLKDGHLNILTRIDPLFIITPILIKYCSEQFRTLHDICSSYETSLESNGLMSKLDYALSPEIDWNLVCETKELDDELFVRFSQAKALEWLLAKHAKTMEAFKTELGDQPSKATLISFATDMIDMYLPACLSDKFKDSVRKQSFNSSLGSNEINVDQKSSRLNSSKRPSEAPQRGGILNFIKRKN